MTRLPAVTARQLVAVAERIGFTFDRQKGFDPSRGVM
jgi:predicted RNA binding protein YcfA (HicA-like mRNA interferase family)